MARIAFWYDFASTYSYLSAMRIGDLARRDGHHLDWKPFLLGPIFGAQGWSDSPFNLYPVKGTYMWRDMERLCAAAGLPWRQPSDFPRNSVLAARIGMIAARDGWAEPYSKAVYQANFVQDRDIASHDILSEIVAALGFDAAHVLALAATPDNRAALRPQTEEAMRIGLFGAPSFTVGDELFWGNDRLEQALTWPGKL